MSQKPVYLVDGLRTVIGNPYGSLKEFTAVGLAAFSVSGLLRRHKRLKKYVDDVIFGNAVSAGTGQNLARQAALLSNLPDRVWAYTVNNVCGSGLQAVLAGIQAVSSYAQISIAGGAESATHSPYLVFRSDVSSPGQKDCFDSLINDGLFCRLTGQTMGQLIEKLVRKHKISRQQQDLFSFESHQKAVCAQAAGKFDDEIIKIKTAHGRVLGTDDRPRRNLKISSFNDLPPAFRKKGTVTAGNSSVPCDGAAAVILASKEIVRKMKIKPMAKILGFSTVGVKPALTFEASVVAVKQALKKCSLGVQHIDLYEVSESFAAQALLTKQQLNISSEQFNIHGGDIALGHPLGATGARSLVTLLHSLKLTRKKRGCVSISFGGGGAIALIVEASF